MFSESKNLLRGRRWPQPPSALSGSGGYRGVLLNQNLRCGVAGGKKKSPRRGLLSYCLSA